MVEELAESGESGWLFLCLDVLRGVGLDRWASRTMRSIVVPLTLVAGLTTWAVTQIPSPAPASTGRTTGLVVTGAVARPIGTPAGSQQLATACPVDPALSSATPPGVVVSPPALVPADLWSVSAAGQGHVGAWCSYAVSVSALPSSP